MKTIDGRNDDYGVIEVDDKWEKHTKVVIFSRFSPNYRGRLAEQLLMKMAGAEAKLEPEAPARRAVQMADCFANLVEKQGWLFQLPDVKPIEKPMEPE